MTKRECLIKILEHGNYAQVDTILHSGEIIIYYNKVLDKFIDTDFGEWNFNLNNIESVTPIIRPIKLMKKGDKCIILEGDDKGRVGVIIGLDNYTEYRIEIGNIDKYYPFSQVAPYFEEEDETDKLIKEYSVKMLEVNINQETYEKVLKEFSEELKKKGEK